MPIRGRTVVRAFVAFGIWVELRPEALSPAIPRTRRIRHVVELVVKLDLFASLVTLLSVLPFLFSSFFFPSFRSFPGTNRTSQALAPCPQAGESDRYAKLRACNEVTRDRNQLSCGSALRRARVCFDPSIFLPIFPRFSRARDNFELIDRGEYLWREIESAKYILRDPARLYARGGVVDIQAVRRTRIRNWREEGDEGMGGRRLPRAV